MARPLVCDGAGKKRLCDGVNQLCSRLNVILKNPLRKPEFFTSSNRYSSINIFNRPTPGETQSWEKVKLRIAELGFYQFSVSLRCFYCLQKSKVLDITPTCDLKITDIHCENDCAWFSTVKAHNKEQEPFDEECPNCYNDVHYLHTLLPCGHLICFRCAFQLEVCPWCTFIISGIVRVRKSGVVNSNGER